MSPLADELADVMTDRHADYHYNLYVYQSLSARSVVGYLQHLLLAPPPINTDRWVLFPRCGSVGPSVCPWL